MVWTRWIARGRADSAVGLVNELSVGQYFTGIVTPEFSADALVKMLCKSFDQSICESLQQNFVVVVSLESLKGILNFRADGNDEAADIIIECHGGNVI